MPPKPSATSAARQRRLRAKHRTCPTNNGDGCCLEPTACTPANLPKQQPPTHLLHQCLTSIGPPKRGVAPSIRNRRARGNRFFLSNITRLPDSRGHARRRCWWCYPTVEQAYELHPERWRCNSPIGAEVVGSGARSVAGSALQPAYRAGLSELDTPLHPGQRQAPSGSNGAGGSRGVPHTARNRWAGVRGNAEPGVGGAVVSLPRGAAHRAAVDGKPGARQAAPAHPGGAFARGSCTSARRAGGAVLVDGQPALRQRHAPAGMPAAAHQGRGRRAWRDRGTRWQRQ